LNLHLFLFGSMAVQTLAKIPNNKWAPLVSMKVLSNSSHYSDPLKHMFLFKLPGATPSSQFKASFILILTLVHILGFQCIFILAIVLISILNSNSGLFSFVPSFSPHCLGGFPHYKYIDASRPSCPPIIAKYLHMQNHCQFQRGAVWIKLPT
jgi:hypothetical protein